MKKIELSQGLHTLVDDEDFDRLNQYKWHVSKDRNTYYAVRNINLKDGKRTRECMHRVILNTPKNMVTDHLDGNGLNNQKSNLRICTYKQNAQNRKHNKNKKKLSKYKGVTYHKRDEVWTAQIFVDGRNKSCGYFEKELDAVIAYNEAAKKYFGEYAAVNII